MEVEPFIPPEAKAKNNLLATLEDPSERDFLAAAEFIVEGDPTIPGQITLVSLEKAIQKNESQTIDTWINSIRDNTPDTEEAPEDLIIWTPEEIKTAQRGDALLNPIIRYLEDPIKLHKQSIDPNIQDIHTYLLDTNGILYKKQTDPKVQDLRGEEEVLVVPWTFQRSAMGAVHNSINGHQGPDRTCWAAHRHFFWRNMDRHLKNFAEKCSLCQKHKGRPHPKVAQRRYPIPDRPWDAISTDLIGPMPSTKARGKFILVCVDFLTRYTATAALTTKSAPEVAEALAKIFCEHGVPSTLLSDNGLEFRNAVMKQLAEKMGFKHHRIACYHPASQGLVERKNAAITQVLRQLCEERGADWDKCLPFATHAVNCAYTSSIQDTPYFLYRHRDPTTPIFNLAHPKTTTKSPEGMESSTEKWKATYDIVRGNLMEASDRRIQYQQKKAHECKIKIDDRVFIKKVRNSPGDNKLTQKWLGPFRVLTQKSPTVFSLKNLTNNKIVQAHVENIKIIKERWATIEEVPNARLPFQEDPQLEINDAENDNPSTPGETPNARLPSQEHHQQEINEGEKNNPSTSGEENTTNKTTNKGKGKKKSPIIPPEVIDYHGNPAQNTRGAKAREEESNAHPVEGPSQEE